MRTRVVRVDSHTQELIERHRQNMVREQRRYVSFSEASAHLARTYEKQFRRIKR